MEKKIAEEVNALRDEMYNKCMKYQPSNYIDHRIQDSPWLDIWICNYLNEFNDGIRDYKY